MPPLFRCKWNRGGTNCGLTGAEAYGLCASDGFPACGVATNPGQGSIAPAAHSSKPSKFVKDTFVHYLEKLGAADALITKTKESLLQHLGSDGPGSAQNAFMSRGDYDLMDTLDRESHQDETWW